MIYFIQESGNPEAPIKIGFTSKHPDRRLLSLQTGYPKRLQVICSMDGSRDDEKRIHEKWSHLRVDGEWFTADSELVGYIKEVGQKSSIEENIRPDIRKIVKDELGDAIRRELYAFFRPNRSAVNQNALRRNANISRMSARLTEIDATLSVFVRNNGPWVGTTGDLLVAIEKVKGGAFPNSSIWLGRGLKRLMGVSTQIKIEPAFGLPNHGRGWKISAIGAAA